MAQDQVTLYNLALSSVATRAKVSALSETSREVQECNLWYQHARDTVFRAAFWPSCRTRKRLALLAERDNSSTQWDQDDPPPPWIFAYGYPSDMIRPRYMDGFARFSLELYQPSSQPEVQCIVTDLEDAILHYTKQQTNLAFWEADLFMAVAHALAAFIAMPIHGKRLRARESALKADDLIRTARAAYGNVEEEHYDWTPPWIQIRGYADAAPQSTFIYPYGPMVAPTAETRLPASSDST